MTVLSNSSSRPLYAIQLFNCLVIKLLVSLQDCILEQKNGMRKRERSRTRNKQLVFIKEKLKMLSSLRHLKCRKSNA